MAQLDEATETSTSDVMYDLVSVLYHALQGMETCGRYLKDAERSGDKALAAFLQNATEANRRVSDEAKELLRARIEEMSAPQGPTGSGPAQRGGTISVRHDGQDAVQEASEESFPASDSPAY
jgi:hypothetical protein